MPARLRALLALARKELLLVLKDPRSRFSILAPPLVQLIVFGYAATYEVRDLPLVVLDESRTPQSRELVADFAQSDAFRQVASVRDVRELTRMIDHQEARAGLHLGSSFARELEQGRAPRIQFLSDGRSSNTAAISGGYARAIVAAYERRRRGAPARGVLAVTRVWFNPNYSSRWFFVPAIMAQLVLVQVILLSALSVARERELGTFDQLLVSPYRPWELLVGKATPALLVGCLQALLALVAAVAWFQVPLRGSLTALAVGLGAFIMSACGVGLFVSSLSRTMQQALLGSFLFLMPSVLLSGLTTPVEDMPRWIQVINQVNPLKYALTIVRGVFLRGSQLADLQLEVLALALIGVATLCAAALMFRSRSR